MDGNASKRRLNRQDATDGRVMVAVVFGRLFFLCRERRSFEEGAFFEGHGGDEIVRKVLI